MNIETIYALAGGLITTGAASFFTWFFSKRKYNSEVDGNNIKNMQDSLQFYITLSDDYRRRLDEEVKSHKEEVAELRKENTDLRQELREQEKRFDDKFASQQKEITAMKNQMLSMYSQICLNFSCTERTNVRTSVSKKKGKVENDVGKK